MDLATFLVHAKKSAYAGQEEGNEQVFSNGCHELFVEKGKYIYRDRYCGYNPFIGEEVVWDDADVIWAMNYYGGLVSDVVDASEVYQFLQEALRIVTKEYPLRGPLSHEKVNFQYKNDMIGTVTNFSGKEKIFYRGGEVYRLIYHGGSVKKK